MKDRADYDRQTDQEDNEMCAKRTGKKLTELCELFAVAASEKNRSR